MHLNQSLKYLRPPHEAYDTVVAKLGEAAGGLFHVATTVRMSFREELIGITDDLLLHCLGQKILLGKRQIKFIYLLGGKSCTGMSLTDAGVSWETFGAQEFRTDDAVANVWFRAVTMDAVGIGSEDSNVVNNGTLFKETAIETEFRMTVGNSQRLVCHIATMAQEQSTQLVVLGIVLVNYCLVVHGRDGKDKKDK